MTLPRGVELADGEQAIGSWTCGIPNSPDSAVVKHEGTLVLTTERIIYEPMRAPRRLSGVLGGGRQIFRLTDVERAEAPEGRQPRLRLSIAGQDPFTAILSGSRFSAPWSKRKWVCLEEALSSINAQQQRARQDSNL